jgi:hypothetical protein
LIWRSNLAQNDPKDPFGTTIWQRFGEAIKHLCTCHRLPRGVDPRADHGMLWENTRRLQQNSSPELGKS